MPALPFYLSTYLVQGSPKSVSLLDVLSSLSPASLSEHLTALRRDITTHFIEFVLTQPLSVTIAQSTDASASIGHKLELFPAPPNSATLVSRLDNLSEILEFLNTHLFGAIPSSQQAAFLKSLSKPLTSGILNRLLVPALPTSLSGLPKYLELLERAVKFENEDLSRILSGSTSSTSTGTESSSENEIKNWVGGIISHYQKQRRVGILDQARKMFTDVSSDWHGTFQVEWTVAPATPALSVNGSASGPPPTVDRLPASTIDGLNGVHSGVEVEQVDDEGWGFGDDIGEEDAQPNREVKDSQRKNPPSPFTDLNAHAADEVDNDAWGWNDGEDLDPTPVPGHGSSSETQGNGNGNGNAVGGAGGDDPLWDAWDDAPPSPPTKKAVPKPATKLEKLSSKSKHGAKPPNIVTQPPEPGPSDAPTRVNPNHLPVPTSAISMSSSWSSSDSPGSQQFQSIPPTPASITVQHKVPKEFYSVSSGMQDILELVESVMLESSEFSRSTLLATYLPATDSASSTSGGTPGSVILNTVPSILDMFRALYPMALQLGGETGSQNGTGKSAASEGSTKKAVQFSNDCLYLEERIRELLPVSSPGSGKTHTVVPPDVWTIDTGLRGKVEDAGKRVKVYGESWFAKTVVRHPSLPLAVFHSP